MALRLVADQAIGESSCSRPDSLRFEGYAEIVASAALDTGGPFTIGVFGEWGVGKTSLMRLVERRLSAQENVVTVWFNAWQYEQEEHPLVPLAGSIVRELQKERSRRSSRVGKSSKALVRGLKALAYGVSVTPAAKMPGLTGVGVSLAFKEVAGKYREMTRDPLLDRSLYYGAFADMEAAKLPSDVRIVVLIDDLDRCFPDNGVKLLESIKLALAQPGFIFILAVAREVIEGYLQHRYAADFGIMDFDGKRYLDKIVQLPFEIPAVGERMPDLCSALLEGQDQEVRQALGTVLPQAAVALGGNPRSAVRFLNNVLLDVAIGKHFAGAPGPEAVPVEYAAISRLLHTGWPGLLAKILSDKAVAQEASTWEEQDLATIAEEVGPARAVAGEIAVTLLSDRALRDALLSPSGRGWLQWTVDHAESIRLLRQNRSVSGLDAPSQATTYDAFLSYQHQDRPEVIQAIRIFDSKGLRVYSDQDLRPGEEWQRALSSALENSRALCVFLGPGTLQSQGVLQEIEAASRQQDATLIIPVLLPEGPRGKDLPPFLQQRQWVDVSQGRQVFEREFTALADYLLSLR